MDVGLRIAGPGDAQRLNGTLARLSADLGDVHAATDDAVARAGWGASPVFRAVIAETGEALAGLALYSPCFSTVRGGAGIHVSDLWAAPDVRGLGLGRRLLAAAFSDGEAVWGAVFVKLSVYHGSVEARGFYRALGFRPLDGQQDLILVGTGCDALREMR